MNRCRWLIVLGVAAACAGGCRRTPPAGPQNLVLTGSGAMAPLVKEIGKRFEAAHPGVRIDVQGGSVQPGTPGVGGSDRGVQDARSGLADVGMVARPLRADESALHPFAVGHDGLVFVVHQTNPVPGLSDEQVVRVYTKQSANWALVGGKDGPITVISQAEGSSALDVFLTRFKLKVGQVRADQTVFQSAQGIKAVAARPAAVAYVSAGAAEAAVAAGTPIRALPLDGVAATAQNVRAGTYPLVRSLYLVTRAPPEGLAKEFIDFAQSAAVRDLVEKYHFVPLP
jgi:phosphate transport system substrate-binding protein